MFQNYLLISFCKVIPLIVICSAFHLYVRAQPFANVDYYLIDSLVLDQLSDDDKELIETSLLQYHNSEDDSLRLAAIENIVDDCWDYRVWPKYNDFIISYIQHKLVANPGQKKQDLYIHFLAGAISNKGYLYDEQGDFLKALEFYHQSLKLYEDINDKIGIGTSFNNLGVLYSVIGDTVKALEYHDMSLKAKLETGDLEGVAMSYNNIGTIYENRQNPFKALDYYEKSLDIRLDIQDSRGIAISYQNIGDIYFLESVYGKALYYYQKSLEIWDSLGITSGVSGCYNDLANVYYRTKQYDKALTYGLKSYKLAEELQFTVEIENAARTLMEIYKSKSDFKSALEFAEIYIANRERIRSNENSRIALKKSMQYEYQKIALRDSLEHVRQNEIRDYEIEKQKTLSYTLYAGIGLLSILFIVGIRGYQRKKRDNRAINEQKQQVEKQKAEIEKQHITLARTHQEISDSISYAKRIQEAILPAKEKITRLLNDAFVYYRPKDVVSGDFYWIVEKGDYLFLAAADCTGHGVPGALVSVVCSNALNRAVLEFNLIQPADILTKTREIVIETFDAEHREVKDGMDISLLRIHQKNNEIVWAGAFNPLYIIKGKDLSLQEVTADKQPVGAFHFKQAFTDHLIDAEPGDVLYLFSDGFVDQFGGPNGKKYKYNPFKNFLIAIAAQPLEEQSRLLNEEFNRWKGNLEQVDDVCVIGVRI